MAGGTVDHADRAEHQQRAEHADGEVLERRLAVAPLATQHQKAEDADQHQLEPDVEIEQVRGEEHRPGRRQQPVQQG
ncbi:MAG: hypothetical protein H6R02_2236, partial [Burkholderiaceae bacterium]|nr:hypothetical protein [Burkholderiaceae bacterium]